MRLFLADLRIAARGLRAVWIDYRLTRIGMPVSPQARHWKAYWS
jgi:hypothetical protein